MNVEILFPVLNEHLRLERGIRRTVQYLEENKDKFAGKAHFSLTIVDNGSDDDTPEIGKRLQSEFEGKLSGYITLRYRRIDERGVGIAFRTGVEESEADVIGYMDIDLSTDIGYLETMVDVFLGSDDIDYVNASRFADESNVSGRKWYRKITSKGLLIILKSQLNLKSTDAICGFTFLKRECAERLVKECSNDNGWFYMIEFLLRAERDGLNIYDMPVEWTEDYDTTVNVPKTVRNYLKNIRRLKKDFKLEEKKERQSA